MGIYKAINIVVVLSFYESLFLS